jgi:MFS family permease
LSSSKIITRTILIVSLVSLFTDISSEMLYPIMPVYLKSIGFTVTLIGLLEGVALFTAGISKGYFGNLSDTSGKRMPFVRLGYILSAVSKPVMGLFTFPVWIFLARISDRLGKGVRTNARDAILSAETTTENKGKVFGFHQSFDTIGAAIGPVCALIYLYFYPGHYREMFLIAFAPAVAGVILTLFVKDKKVAENNGKPKPGLLDFLKYWKRASVPYKKVVPALLFFALLNSSDTFLLLMMKHQGLTDTRLIIVYIFYNIFFAVMAYPAGWLGDKFGLKYTFISGCVLFACVYLAFPFTHSFWVFGLLFMVYGFYAAATDGISRAWITNLSTGTETATALGFYTSLASIGTLIASIAGGILWDYAGPSATFLVPGIGVLALVIYMLKLKN